MGRAKEVSLKILVFTKKVITHPAFLRLACVLIAILLCVILSVSVPATAKEGKEPSKLPAYTLGVAAMMGFLWMTNQISGAITGLIPVFMFPILGISSGSEVSSAYVNHVSMLFIGGFLLSLAMQRWGVDRRLALIIIFLTLKTRKGVTKINRLPLILFGFMFTSYFLSMFLSNTACALIMVPNALALVKRLEQLIPQKSPGKNKIIRPFATALFLGIAYGGNVGGIATLVGTPPNLILLRQIELPPIEKRITFFQWSLFAFPLSLVFMIFLYLYFHILFVFRTMRNIKKEIAETYQIPSEMKSLTGKESQIVDISRSVQYSVPDSKKGENSNTEDDTNSDVSKDKDTGTSQSTRISIDSLPDRNSIDIEGDRTSVDIARQKKPEFKLDLSKFEEEYKRMGRLSYEEFMVIFLFFVVVVLWTTRSIEIPGVGWLQGWEILFKPKYMNDGTVAILFGFLLFIIPAKRTPPSIAEKQATQRREKSDSQSEKKQEESNDNNDDDENDSKVKHYALMNWDSTMHQFPWDIILLFGGGFALSDAFSSSGLSGVIAQQLEFFESFPTIIIIAIICICISVATAFTSNIATIQIFLPILSSLSQATGIPPLLLMIPATICSSYAFVLPVSTAPNAIAYGYSEKRVTIFQMVSTGSILNIVGIVLTTVVGYFLVVPIFGA